MEWVKAKSSISCLVLGRAANASSGHYGTNRHMFGDETLKQTNSVHSVSKVSEQTDNMLALSEKSFGIFTFFFHSFFIELTKILFWKTIHSEKSIAQLSRPFLVSLHWSFKSELTPSGQTDSWTRGGNKTLFIDFCFCGKAHSSSVFQAHRIVAIIFAAAWCGKKKSIIEQWNINVVYPNAVLITSTDAVLAFCLYVF